MRILHYEVIRQLGAGGMGTVHLAEDTKLNRRVALKFLPEDLAEDSERLQRFRSEAQALASLNHPNIVSIYSVEQDDERTFLVMELVDGETLAGRLKGKPFKRDEFFDVAIAMADGLATAHERGIVHRDLKPSNVMLTREGAPKILDFGLAKPVPAEEERISTTATTDLHTREGRVVGTPSFMSPEQLEGRQVDHRSDIFSLGIILYQMAVGKQPFSGKTEAEVVSSILRDTPDAADKVRPDLPHHLGRLLRLCLDKNVDHRLQSVQDLRNELMELRRELSTGEVAVQQAMAPSRWTRLRFPLAVAIIILLVLSVVGIRQLEDESTSEPEVATDVRMLLDQGRLMEMRGDTLDDLTAAEDRYRRALELAPEEPMIRARLAMILARVQAQYPESERSEEIRALTGRALADDPGLALAHVVEGVQFLLDGDASAAEGEARQAIEFDAQDYRGYSLLGKALIAQDHVETGLSELRQAVQLAGADIRARLALAKVLQDLGQTNEAATEYEKILAYAPDYPNALNNLAIIYARSGRDLDAIPLFKRLLRVRRSESAANNLGMIYMRQGRLDEAIGALLEANDINPEKAVIQHSLGEAYEKAGLPAAARPWFETAFESYGRDLEAGGDRATGLGLRAVCAAKLGRFGQARQDIHEALELSPNHLYRVVNAAQVYALAADHKQAYQYVQAAVKGGYSPNDFLDDPAFAAYRDRPDFLELLESDTAH